MESNTTAHAVKILHPIRMPLIPSALTGKRSRVSKEADRYNYFTSFIFFIMVQTTLYEIISDGASLLTSWYGQCLAE